MKKAICHYSYHRTLKEKNWTLKDFVEKAEGLGIEGIDFHARFLPAPSEAPGAIKKALAGSSLELSGLSLSTDFNCEGQEFDEMVEKTKEWIQAAGELGAKISRIFGGGIKDRSDSASLNRSLERILRAMEILVPEAEKNGVVLAIENHGGLPGTGQEQVDIIKKIDSPFFKATVDVGNYMSCGQDSVEGSTLAAPYCAYVHFKDFKKTDEGLRSCIVGAGDVDHAGCLRALAGSGYNGYVALEYEGKEEDELTGVSKSIAFMLEVMKDF